MSVGPGTAIDALRRHVLVDGFDLVLDVARSQGSTLVDARTGAEYLDLLTFFGSLPLGMNHPAMAQDERFMAELGRAALHKVSNPDIYTVEYARFVDTFVRVLGDPRLPHLFFIDGGALAVENALKVAFDWKARRPGVKASAGLSVMHLEGAFHGRSGYTLSLTNAGNDAVTAGYPQWTWPRIPVPPMVWPPDDRPDGATPGDLASLAVAREHFERDGDRIACFIAEPVLGAGGDVHLSAGFLHGMQRLCREYGALFVLDEVQTGCGLAGTPWVYQQLDLAPDVVAFGKKTQVCGVMAGGRVDDTADNAFTVSDRIGSTWGGNLVDMVRATRILEIIEADRLMPSAVHNGVHLLDRLRELAERHPRTVSGVRGRGLMCALDLPDRATRDAVLRTLRTEERVLLLPGGERALRFRPALTTDRADLDRGVDAVDRTIRKLEDTHAGPADLRGGTPALRDEPHARAAGA